VRPEGRGGIRGVMPGALTIVPTPIGDPADGSLRAREVLARADLVAAEDTRVAARLLEAWGLPPRPMWSTHDHNEEARAAEIVRRIQEGAQVALVSDAGTPLVSDPGYRVVRAAVDAGVPVVVLPGPCAAVTALVGSALPPDRFLFLGFLPRDAGPRDAVLDARRFEEATLVLYEAPHRVVETLRAVRRVLGARRVTVARSLTKVWEEWLRGDGDEVAERLAAEGEVRGEFTVVVEGFRGPPGTADAARVEALVEALVDAGVPLGTVRDVVAGVYALPRRDVYQRALRHRDRERT
jgi:16S rRNA (cytidine1402-2'-O)-methyltransferase